MEHSARCPFSHAAATPRIEVEPQDPLYSLPFPPGSFGLPLIGESVAFVQDPMKFVEERRARYGDVFASNLLGRKTAFLLGPEANEWIFSGMGKFLDNEWPYCTSQILGRDSLSMIVGEKHRERRKLLSPHFKRSAVASCLPRIEEITRKHLRQWERTGNLRVVPAMRKLTFELAATYLLGNTDDIDLEALEDAFETWGAGLISAVPINLPVFTFGRAKRAGKQLSALIGDLVDRRAQARESSPDILGRLLTIRDEQGKALSRQTIIDEVEFLLYAGHDTVVAAMSNLVLHLAQYPQVLETARAEQRALLDRPISMDTLQQMTYLDQVIHESMRLVPPVNVVFRRVTREVSFRGYRLPKDWQIAHHFWGAHTMPEAWSDPMRFDPSRFEEDRIKPKQQVVSWIPFSGGNRLCLGMHFAMVEIHLVVGLLMRHYQWTLLPGQDLSFKAFPFPIPRDQLWIRLSPYDPSEKRTPTAAS